MINPMILESKFQDFMDNLEAYAPDGIVPVDLHLLRSMGLLRHEEESLGVEHPLTHYFHVIETEEKITLFNDQFVVWIVPQVIDEQPITVALIATLTSEEPHLELVFSAAGVYNSSRMVLKVLEKFLEEIQETERVLARLSDVS